MTAENNTNML